jgi:hypothetical protein
MTKPQDDFDAVRIVVETVQSFDAPSQERIFRWAREKLGLGVPALPPGAQGGSASGADSGQSSQSGAGSTAKDIKSFIAAKSPKSDNQFAAVVAYYYKFEAPTGEQKAAIVANDLQDATRKAGRDRLRRPIDTLHSAHKMGLLDKAGRGEFTLNTVGENLVAMTLPQGSDTAPAPARRRSPRPRKRPKKR